MNKELKKEFMKKFTYYWESMNSPAVLYPKIENVAELVPADDLWKWIETNIEKEKKEFWTDICLYIAKNKLMKPKDYLKFTKFFYEKNFVSDIYDKPYKI